MWIQICAVAYLLKMPEVMYVISSSLHVTFPSHNEHFLIHWEANSQLFFCLLQHTQYFIFPPFFRKNLFLHGINCLLIFNSQRFLTENVMLKKVMMLFVLLVCGFKEKLLFILFSKQVSKVHLTADHEFRSRFVFSRNCRNYTDKSHICLPF